MIDILQGLNFVNYKENYKNLQTSKNIKELEKSFSEHLNEFKIKYSLFKQNYTTLSKEEQIRSEKEIKNVNEKLMEIMDVLYSKIVALKLDKKNDVKGLKKTGNLLNEYNDVYKKYNHLKTDKKLITLKAFENDYKIKTNLKRVRYIIWLTLASILFVSVIIRFVLNIELGKVPNMGIFIVAVFVGITFINMLWTALVKYCKNSIKKNSIICSIVAILEKVNIFS